MKRIEDLDPNMITKSPDGDLAWYDLRKMHLEGQGWPEESAAYTRLPTRAKRKVRPEVWDLSRHSAGLCLRFATDASSISFDWQLLLEGFYAMDHMPATGCSGVDLYVRTGKGWRWLGIGRPTGGMKNRTSLAHSMPEGRHEFLLYLPLYNAVKRARLGLPVGATLELLPPPTARPVVFYGTSIVHGGCASRTGMAYPSILGRKLDTSTINLGFSGNGWMEPDMGEFVAELDASCFVLDPLPNNDLQGVKEKTAPFVRTIRAAHPETPIVLVETIIFEYCHFNAAANKELRDKNTALRRIKKQLEREGMKDLHLIPGKDLIGHDGEATVDGVHPTDVGFLRMAEGMAPALKRVLNKKGKVR
jgi:lysophospholipase L1-like esterase